MVERKGSFTKKVIRLRPAVAGLRRDKWAESWATNSRPRLGEVESHVNRDAAL